MRVMTQNLHCFAEENYIEKFERIAQFIVENDVEVVCLQEVAQAVISPIYDEKWGVKEGNGALIIRDMIEKISGQKYALFYSFAHYYYDTDEEGVALLTKLPILSCEEHLISDEKEVTIDRRTALEIQLENGISISTLHLGIISEREVESPALKQFLTLKDETTGSLKLFFGDYNIPDTTEAYEMILQSGCVDLMGNVKGDAAFLTTPGTIDGWKSDKGAKRLDYGFANQAVSVKTARVIFNGQREPMVSDHFGLYFDLEV